MDWLKTLSQKQIIAFLILFGFVLYLPALFNGFVADDNVYILANPQIRNFDLLSFFLGSSSYEGDVSHLTGVYYKPIFTLITSLLFVISQGTPFLFHLSQLSIHIINSVLLFLLFSHFFSK